MGVREALEVELRAAGQRVERSTLAATALALADALDGDSSATSKSMCAKSMVDVLRELRALSPPRVEADGITDLNAERNARRAGVAASANL